MKWADGAACKARIFERVHSNDYVHLWSTLGTFSGNPMGVHWTGIVFGLGGAIACGYWTTDFLVVQRAMAAKDLRSAQLAPIIASYFKMVVPLIVILPGLLGLAVLPYKLVPQSAARPGHAQLQRSAAADAGALRGPGLLGLGITALIAGFMSGMAGNVSAFATVWTYDIYQPYIKKGMSDAHYVRIGRWCTILGVFLSIGTAYFVTNFKSIMDYMQALVGFFISPLFGTVILGMLWKRATPKGGFWGLLAGTGSSVAMYTAVRIHPAWIRYVALSPDAKDMAENLYRALWSLLICILVTIVVSLFTEPKPKEQLQGLVWSYTMFPVAEKMPFWKKPCSGQSASPSFSVCCSGCFGRTENEESKKFAVLGSLVLELCTFIAGLVPCCGATTGAKPDIHDRFLPCRSPKGTRPALGCCTSMGFLLFRLHGMRQRADRWQ